VKAVAEVGRHVVDFALGEGEARAMSPSRLALVRSFRNSSLSRPPKPSMKACWAGLRGSRHIATLVITAGALSCAPNKVAEQAVVLPAPTAPTLHAPICARPAEEVAIDVSAVVSMLQVITISCHTDDK
jgi:hypothetical protein